MKRNDELGTAVGLWCPGELSSSLKAKLFDLLSDGQCMVQVSHNLQLKDFMLDPSEELTAAVEDQVVSSPGTRLELAKVVPLELNSDDASGEELPPSVERRLRGKKESGHPEPAHSKRGKPRSADSIKKQRETRAANKAAKLEAAHESFQPKLAP